MINYKEIKYFLYYLLLAQGNAQLKWSMKRTRNCQACAHPAEPQDHPRCPVATRADTQREGEKERETWAGAVQQVVSGAHFKDNVSGAS